MSAADIIPPNGSGQLWVRFYPMQEGGLAGGWGGRADAYEEIVIAIVRHGGRCVAARVVMVIVMDSSRLNRPREERRDG